LALRIQPTAFGLRESDIATTLCLNKHNKLLSVSEAVHSFPVAQGGVFAALRIFHPVNHLGSATSSRVIRSQPPAPPFVFSYDIKLRTYAKGQ